jgi:hypothetical protein
LNPDRVHRGVSAGEAGVIIPTEVGPTFYGQDRYW